MKRSKCAYRLLVPEDGRGCPAREPDRRADAAPRCCAVDAMDRQRCRTQALPSPFRLDEDDVGAIAPERGAEVRRRDRLPCTRSADSCAREFIATRPIFSAACGPRGCGRGSAGRNLFSRGAQGDSHSSERARLHGAFWVHPATTAQLSPHQPGLTRRPRRRSEHFSGAAGRARVAEQACMPSKQTSRAKAEQRQDRGIVESRPRVPPIADDDRSSPPWISMTGSSLKVSVAGPDVRVRRYAEVPDHPARGALDQKRCHYSVG